MSENLHWSLHESMRVNDTAWKDFLSGLSMQQQQIARDVAEDMRGYADQSAIQAAVAVVISDGGRLDRSTTRRLATRRLMSGPASFPREGRR